MSRFDHVAAVIGGVIATAARDAHRKRLVVLDWAEPESRLLERILLVADVRLPLERASDAGGGDFDTLRAHARLLARSDALVLDPVNKTVAVLWPERLAEPVLPLADLYASQIEALGGAATIPAEARDLVERAGGVRAVDEFLTKYLDERRPLEQALAGNPAAGALRQRFEAGWWWRRRVGVVPKIGPRTLGIDLR